MEFAMFFGSNLFVIALFLLGLAYTFREFGRMDKNPTNFRDDHLDGPKVIY